MCFLVEIFGQEIVNLMVTTDEILLRIKKQKLKSISLRIAQNQIRASSLPTYSEEKSAQFLNGGFAMGHF